MSRPLIRQNIGGSGPLRAKLLAKPGLERGNAVQNLALTLARGVVVRPFDDAVAVEVAAVPRPERIVLRALRKAVAYNLRRRRARLGKRTRARKLSPLVRARGLGKTGFARNPVLFFSLALFS